MDDVKIAAFTGRLDDPASFFRMRQHFPALESAGFTIKDYLHPCLAGCWHRGLFKVIPYLGAIHQSRNYDLIWICRTMVRGAETFELLLKRPRVMDVDDAIWLNEPFGKQTVPHLARHMDIIVAGNNFLADWFSKYCRNIYIVPTAIDIERYQVHPVDHGSNKFIIGWTGTSSNFKYLQMIEKPLLQFLQNHPDAQLKIIADARWRSEVVPSDKIVFVPWSRDTEITALYDMSVGIMPLMDTPWARGKCSFKMLQYMAVGLPVAVSPVGMNVEVLDKGEIGFAANSEGEWYEALEVLYKHESLRHKFGQAGRAVVEQYYNADNIANELARILQQAAGISISED